jgi:manganese/iron transport system substrate-binding protein
VNWFSLGSVAVLGLCLLCGCAQERRPAAKLAVVPSAKISVVTTTTILVDLVKAVGGDLVTVRGIVPPGVSVESYEPAPQDVAAVHDARLLVENGAGLERWLQPLIENAKAAEVPLIVLSSGLPLIDRNPHLWMDPLLVRSYVARIRDGLSSVDPPHRNRYQRNARLYAARLLALKIAIERQIATIPRERRVMLVYHDAWRYYDRRFGLRTLGVIEPTPGREPSAAAIAALVDRARAAGVSTVFSEPEESSRLAEALASSFPGGRVVPLSVDTLGPTPQSSDYLGMMSYDTRAIVTALR